MKYTKHGAYFPLFAKSIEHNETIEGVDLAMLQMKRDRRRLKRQNAKPINPDVAEKLFSFAKTKPVPNVPEGAGFVRAPVIESDATEIYEAKAEPTEEMIDALRVGHEQAVEDHENTEMSKAARALTGRKARIVNLPGKTG